MSRIILFPYKIGSKSCGDLAAALKARNVCKTLRVHPDRRYRFRPNDIVINWGNSEKPAWNYPDILNDPDAVKIAVNKLSTLEKLKESGVDTVPFCTDPDEALTWGGLIVSRVVLDGHSGEGITISEEPVAAPLYTKFIPRTREYRVHVFKGAVIDYAKKVKRNDGKIVSRVKDDNIRSHLNGWEYLRDVAPRDSVRDIAIAAVAALGLDFGAVDVIRDREGNNYVLEVGTAAGLSSVGVEAYSNAIIELLHG